MPKTQENSSARMADTNRPGDAAVNRKVSSLSVLPSRSNSWRPGQVALVVLAVLVLGIALGYLFRSSSSLASVASPSSTDQRADSNSSANFDGRIRPLLRRLEDNPNDPDLLVNIGNAYYDHRDYDKAIGYYRRYLELRPQDASVRTDMGTAIWYSGDPDQAIQQYETALSSQPDYANTLFNLGMVKWQGKHDDQAAIECWERLLKVHPDYVDRQKAEDLIRKVQGESVQKLIQKVEAEPNQ